MQNPRDDLREWKSDSPVIPVAVRFSFSRSAVRANGMEPGCCEPHFHKRNRFCHACAFASLFEKKQPSLSSHRSLALSGRKTISYGPITKESANISRIENPDLELGTSRVPATLPVTTSIDLT